MAWAKLKPLLTRDLGGPPLLPKRALAVRIGFTIALIVSLVVLVLDQAWLRTPLPPYVPPPSPTPTQAPHFALDDADLGPQIRLYRFYPTDDVLDGYAIEGGDGRLYVSYPMGVKPSQWGMEGPWPPQVGILDAGRVTLIRFDARKPKAMPEISAEIDGLWNGMPVVRVRDSATEDHYAAITPSGVAALSQKPPVVRPWPCIAFNGGRMCQVMSGRRWQVSVSLPGREPMIIKGAPYVMGPPYEGRPDTGIVKLLGGGRHHFLLVEYHPGQDAAECLEGEAP